jgi:hypothetical protein
MLLQGQTALALQTEQLPRADEWSRQRFGRSGFSETNCLNQISSCLRASNISRDLKDGYQQLEYSCGFSFQCSKLAIQSPRTALQRLDVFDSK